VLALGAECEQDGKNPCERREVAIVLRTTNPNRTLWEAILPPGFEDLPAELGRVDRLLDDPASVVMALVGLAGACCSTRCASRHSGDPLDAGLLEVRLR
jgi:hypothetical protein